MPSLVLLHGFTGTPSSWDVVCDRMRTAPDLLRPSLLGHAAEGEPDAGTPPLPSGDAGGGFLDEVDRLAAQIAARTEPPRHLAGYSLGGRLSLGLLAHHAGLFESATVIGAHPGLEDRSAREARRVADGRWIAMLDGAGLQTFVDAWEALPLFASQARAPRERLAAQRRARLAHDPRGLARSLAACGLGRMPPLTAALAAVDPPLTLVVGAEDEKFRRLAESLGARVTAAELVVVPESGHNVVLEQPEAVARLLDRAVERLGG